jgi:hypothetical protein
MDFKAFRIMLSLEVLLLFIQFWLGMYVNLFVNLPLYKAQDFSSYAGGQEVISHIAVGVTIFLLAGLILSYGSRLKKLQINLLATFGVVFVILAPLTGATFLFRDQDNILSMAMAISFLLAFTVYLAIFYLVDKLKS